MSTRANAPKLQHSAAEPAAPLRHARLVDVPVDVKVALSGLWVAMLFVFAYVDIFGFWRADVINGALAKEIPQVGFTIDQTFLLLTTVYIVVPSLMIVVSLLTPARINRWANVVVSVLYLVSVAVSMIGETWAYYLLGSVVEVLLLGVIAMYAWRWPHQAS